MIKLTFYEQLAGVAYSLVVGAALGALYDVVRVIRVMLGLRPGFSHRRVKLPLIGTLGEGVCPKGAFAWLLVFFGDLIYFFSATVIYVVFIFQAANGEARWFFTLGALLGFLLWFFTAGRLVLRFAETICLVFRCALRYTAFFLSFPILLAYKKALLPLAGRIEEKIGEKRTKKARKTLAKSLRFVYNIDEE